MLPHLFFNYVLVVLRIISEITVLQLCELLLFKHHFFLQIDIFLLVIKHLFKRIFGGTNLKIIRLTHFRIKLIIFLLEFILFLIIFIS